MNAISPDFIKTEELQTVTLFFSNRKYYSLPLLLNISKELYEDLW